MWEFLIGAAAGFAAAKLMTGDNYAKLKAWLASFKAKG